MTIGIASTSYAQLAYQPETEVGVTPNTGKGTDLRMTGESLDQTFTKEASTEINSSRQTTGLTLTDAQTSGGFNFVLSSREYDAFFEALLMDDWSKFGTNGVLDVQSVTISYDAATSLSKLEIAAARGVDFTKLLNVGSYFLVSADEADAELKFPLIVAQLESNAIYVKKQLKDASLVTNSKLYHGHLSNGGKYRSFSLEKRLTDKDKTFLYKGMHLNKMSLSFESQSAISGNFDFIGTESEFGTGRQLGDKSEYIPSQSGSPINTVVGMKGALLDGIDVRENMTAAIQKLSLEYDNAMKGHKGIGVLGNVAITAGTINAGGTMTMYFNDGSIYNDIKQQVHHRLEFAVYDPDGHGYAFIFPCIELKDPKVAISAKDEAVETELGFTALQDTDNTQKTLIIERF